MRLRKQRPKQRARGRLTHWRRAARQAATARSMAPGGLQTAEWRAVLDAFAYRCAYCDVDCENASIELDHFISVERGGLSVVANVVPACTRCNRAKGCDDPLRPMFWAAFAPTAQQRVLNYIRECGGPITPNAFVIKHRVERGRRLCKNNSEGYTTGSDRHVTCDACRALLFKEGRVRYV